MVVVENMFTEATYYRCPPLTADALAEAEARLGYRLPESYTELLRVQNGGTLKRQCFPTAFTTSWAPNHIGVDAILGVGGPRGIDAQHGSDYLIREWGYPDIGIVFASTPSGGHDAVMFDYTADADDPPVVYVDEDRLPHRIADGFQEFCQRLVDCAQLSADH